MKKITALLALLLASQMLLAQQTTPSDWIELKCTPTSLLNGSKPSLLVGVEVLPKKSFGLQFEYGIPAPFLFSNFERKKHNWLFHRFKFSVKQYTSFGRDYNIFFGVGIYHTDHTYTLERDTVQLMSGATVTFTDARLHLTETSLFGQMGGKVWLSPHFFMEYYFGWGWELTGVDVIKLNGAVEIILSEDNPFPSWNAFLRNDVEEGRRYVPFLDFGLKAGCSF